jgi:hypothetical protein
MTGAVAQHFFVVLDDYPADACHSELGEESILMPFACGFSGKKSRKAKKGSSFSSPCGGNTKKPDSRMGTGSKKHKKARISCRRPR